MTAYYFCILLVPLYDSKRVLTLVLVVANVDAVDANFTACGTTDVVDQHESSIEYNHRSCNSHLARHSL